MTKVLRLPEGHARERRERIATAVLAGLLSDTDRTGHIADFARYACRFADALIAELDKEAADGDR